MGDGANDTGFLILDNVRIPREHMLARFAYVTKEGKYHSNKMDPKLHYSTMMYTRAAMVGTAGLRL
jgi:acyl-CoA oxidase